MDLSFESYLYPAGMTHLEMALPIHLHPGGWPAMAERLRQPGVRDIAVAGLAKYLGRGDQIVGYSRSGRHVGQRTVDLAAAAGKSMAEFAFDLVMEEEGAVTMVYPWQTPVEEHERVITDTAVHPAHDGRQRRRLRRAAPAPAQLRLLRPRAGRVRPRTRPR